jgi:AAA+ ATPase superfamily predicted ATPase
METPFIYGRLAVLDNYTNRQKERELLKNNFDGLINTVIISPRRWGKTSLVKSVSADLQKTRKDISICHVDIFNCKTEGQFLQNYANAVLKATFSVWEEFISATKKYLGQFIPNVTLSDAAHNFELSFGIDFKEKRSSLDEIIDLPQRIAEEKKKKIVV